MILEQGNTNPRTPSQDLAGLRSTYSFEKVGSNIGSNDMLKLGQTPMEVNAMPGVILEESEDEGGKISGDVKALKAKDSCFFCKKTDHQKRDCLSYRDWKSYLM